MRKKVKDMNESELNDYCEALEKRLGHSPTKGICTKRFQSSANRVPSEAPSLSTTLAISLDFNNKAHFIQSLKERFKAISKLDEMKKVLEEIKEGIKKNPSLSTIPLPELTNQINVLIESTKNPDTDLAGLATSVLNLFRDDTK